MNSLEWPRVGEEKGCGERQGEGGSHVEEGKGWSGRNATHGGGLKNMWTENITVKLN